MRIDDKALSILIVTYNSADVLPPCLDSILHNPPSHDYEVVICDNGSSDDTLETLRRGPWEVRVVANTSNLGFAGGNLLAAGQARGRLLLLLNPDTVVLPGALDALIDALLSDKDNWVAGACLLTADGAFDSAGGQFPTLAYALSSALPWQRILALLGMRVRPKRPQECSRAGSSKPSVVDWVSGAALLVRRDAWDALGGLCAEYFLYFEEIDFCSRVYASGGRVVVAPAAQIIHLVSASVGRDNWRKSVWFTDGLIKFFRRNRSPLSTLVAQAWIVSVNGILWCVASIAGVFSARLRGRRQMYACRAAVGLGSSVERVLT